MCQDMIITAQVGDYQYIAYCEHRTIHLGWNFALFHLQPTDFLRVARLLERSQVEAQMTEVNDHGYCCLMRQQNSCYQLWLGNSVLFLTEPELPKLIELVQRALPQLSHLFSDEFFYRKSIY